MSFLYEIALAKCISQSKFPMRRMHSPSLRVSLKRNEKWSSALFWTQSFVCIHFPWCDVSEETNFPSAALTLSLGSVRHPMRSCLPCRLSIRSQCCAHICSMRYIFDDRNGVADSVHAKFLLLLELIVGRISCVRFVESYTCVSVPFFEPFINKFKSIRLRHKYIEFFSFFYRRFDFFQFSCRK